MGTSCDSDSNQVQPRRRVVKYEFVWLNERRKSTPRWKDWNQLTRNGRVKETEVNLQMKARHLGELVRTNFPELRNADLTRYFFNVRLHAGANIIERLSSRIQPLR